MAIVASGEVFKDLFRHNVWANERLIDACAPLADQILDAAHPGTYGNARDTLLHLLGAEGRYVLRLSGIELEGAVSERSGFPGFEAMRASARMTGQALIDLVDQVGPDDESPPLRVGDREYKTHRRVVLVQAINHSTEHRAHVMSSITAQGVDAIELDGWAWGEASGYVRTVE